MEYDPDLQDEPIEEKLPVLDIPVKEEKVSDKPSPDVIKEPKPAPGKTEEKPQSPKEKKEKKEKKQKTEPDDPIDSLPFAEIEPLMM